MNETSNSETDPGSPKWFYVLSILLPLWNVIGVATFFSHMSTTTEQIESMPAVEQQLYLGIPLWANITFAIGVFSGTLGSLALVLKNALAYSILLLSLGCVLVHNIHTLLIANTLQVFGMCGLIMPMIVSFISMFLVWLANDAKHKGWLN
jgi:hypothetical protein